MAQPMQNGSYRTQNGLGTVLQMGSTPDEMRDTLGSTASDNHVIVGNYNIQIGSIHGSEINIHSPEQAPLVRPRSTPVLLLPRPFPQLVGRREEIYWAIASVESLQSAELYGKPGLGKTVLLRHLAYLPQLTSPFDHGAVYLSGRYYTAPDYLQALHEAFYESEPNYKPTVEQIRHALMGRKILVLLDDQPSAEHEADRQHQRFQLETLMNVLPDATFLLSSPQRYIWGEGNSLPLKGLALSDTLALIEQDLQRPLTSAEKPAAEQLWQILRGHPQDILYATGHVRCEGVSLDQVLQQMQSPAPRKFLIQHIWSHLSKSQRLVLASIAALSGITLLGQWLATMTSVPNLEAVLDSLVERRLLETVEQRYGVSPSIASVIEEGLNLDPARLQALNQYTAWAEQHGASPDDFIEELDGILYSLEWAVQSGKWAEALRLMKAIESPLALSKRWGVWAKVLRWALLAGRSLSDPATEAWALHQLGSQELCLNEIDMAYEHLLQALQIREALGDQVGAAVTRHNLNLLLLPSEVQPEEAPAEHPLSEPPGDDLLVLEPMPAPQGESEVPPMMPTGLATQVVTPPALIEQESRSGLPLPLKILLILLPLAIGGAIGGYLIWQGLTPSGSRLLANDDEIVITEASEDGTPIELDVLSNDQAADGRTLTLVSVTQPQNGIARIEDGTLLYTPNPDFAGVDQFSYEVDDGAGQRAQATVVVIFRPDATGNRPPEATDIEVATDHNTLLQIAALESVRDPDGDRLTITLEQLPENGTAELSRDGSVITYTPTDGFAGQDRLTYQVSDRQGGVAIGTVTITVNAPPLSAPDQTYETRYATATTLNVLAEIPYPESLLIRVVSDPQYGSATVNDNGTITYAPGGDFYGGTDTFDYRVSNGLQIATGTITVRVLAPRLTAPDYTATTNYNTPTRINVLRENPYPGEITVAIARSPQRGTASPSDSGNILYTPNDDFSGGQDTFTYRLSTLDGSTADGTITIDVAPPDLSAPDYTLQTANGQPARIDLLQDVSYPNLGELGVSISSRPQNGSVEFGSDRVVIYEPRAGFAGTDRFRYTLNDRRGRSASGTVAIQVSAPPPPSAANDQASTRAGERVAINVLSNDQGSNLSIESVSSPSNGSASNSGTAIIYVPNQGFSGTDRFQYTVRDGLGRTATATVAVTVEALPNRPPTARDDQVSTSYFQPIDIDVLSNDDDPDGDRLQIVDVTAPGNGSLTLNGTIITYSPNRGFYGTDRFQYVVSDGNQTVTATVVVTVQAEGPI